MKRATRTLTLRTTRWTLIERIAYLNDPYPIPLFKTTYRRITPRNINLLRLRDTSPLHVSVIYQITYIFFFRTNLVISAALETTERSSGTKRREKNENPHLIKWKKEREREKNPSNVRKTIVRPKNARRLSIRYLGEDCFQEDEAFSVRGKFRGSRFTSGFLFLTSMDHVPTYARFNVRAKPTSISKNFRSHWITIDDRENSRQPPPLPLDRSGPRNHRCFTHEERARHVTAALSSLLLLNSGR